MQSMMFIDLKWIKTGYYNNLILT